VVLLHSLCKRNKRPCQFLSFKQNLQEH
jgi:hypothetical protein